MSLGSEGSGDECSFQNTFPFLPPNVIGDKRGSVSMVIPAIELRV